MAACLLITAPATEGARELTFQECLNAIRLWRVGDRNKYCKAADMNYLADFARFSFYPLACLQYHATPNWTLRPPNLWSDL